MSCMHLYVVAVRCNREQPELASLAGVATNELPLLDDTATDACPERYMGQIVLVSPGAIVPLT